MRNTKGFTLLEIMIVVVIAVSVAAFAVPAYKKAQDRNRYLAAQGVLIDLGNGVKMLREALSTEAEGRTFPVSNTVLQITSEWQNNKADKYVDNSLANYVTESSANDDLGQAMFSRRYASAVAFTGDNGSSFMGYKFFVCPQNSASSNQCCNSQRDAVACMADENFSSRSTNGQYYGAVYLQSGTVKQLEKTK